MSEEKGMTRRRALTQLSVEPLMSTSSVIASERRAGRVARYTAWASGRPAA